MQVRSESTGPPSPTSSSYPHPAAKKSDNANTPRIIKASIAAPTPVLFAFSSRGILFADSSLSSFTGPPGVRLSPRPGRSYCNSHYPPRILQGSHALVTVVYQVVGGKSEDESASPVWSILRPQLCAQKVGILLGHS